MAISITNKFKALSDKMSSLSTDASILQRIDHRLFNASRIAEKKREIHRKVTQEMIPAIRTALSAAYRNSGLNIESGELFSAVAGAKVTATDKGILVTLGTDNERILAQANALQHGSVHTGKKNGRTSAHKAYDFFNLRFLDADAIYMKYYQQAIDEELAK